MSTVNLPARELVAALTAVIPMAGVDDTLPILTCVHFETRDGQLHLATTDRYLLGTFRVEGAEIEGEVSANIEGRDVKDLLAFARKAKVAPLTLTFGEHDLTVSDFERVAIFRTFDGDFPKVWAILDGLGDQPETVFGVNPHKIAAFAKAAGSDKTTPIRLSLTSPVKPIRVELGDRFVGVVMPVRLPDVTKVHPDAEAKVEPVVSPPTKVEVDGVTIAETRHVDLHPDEPAEQTDDVVETTESVTDVAEGEVGAEPTELDCPTCKGFGVVKGKPDADGKPRPFRTANGAATATTAVVCPTCQGDRIAAA